MRRLCCLRPWLLFLIANGLTMNLNNLSVVLVESRGERNIGSVARAMANFGVTDLRLVAPQVDHLHDEARKMAPGPVQPLQSPGLPACQERS